MVSFVLRNAQQADFPAVKAIIRRAGINPFELDWRRFLLAVTPTGEVIGCAQIKPHQGGIRELASLAVVEQYRGHGVARVLIQKLISQNSPPLYLTCRSGLEPFYQKFGFKTVGLAEMPSYYRNLSRIANLLMKLTGKTQRLIVMKYG